MAWLLQEYMKLKNIKKMKRLIYVCSFLLAIVASSCNDDEGYSLDNYIISSATYRQLDGAFYLVNDNGETLWPEANNVSTDLFYDGDRVTVNYTALGADPNGYYDYIVEINNMEKMLTKDMLIFDETTTDFQRDSVGRDPIVISGAWVVDDYLTLTFEMPIAYTTHMITVVEDLTLNATDDGAIILALRQNDFNAPLTGYVGWGIASFNIAALKDQVAEGTTSLKIALRSTNEGGGDIDYETVIDYDFGPEAEPASVKIPNRELMGSDKIK